ncbi:MAG: hypothetical protein R3281_01675 [Balneolaceae bacterium]|nr:hypothetical protein [Balneolaceae bacterium]
MFNADYFDLEGVIVNATPSASDIENQYAEAKRVMQLCRAYGNIPLEKG